MKHLIAKCLNLHIISQYSTIGLTIIMSTLTLFVLFMGASIQQNTRNAETASKRLTAYNNVYAALNQEEKSLDDYTFARSVRNWQTYQANAQQTVDAFHHLQQMPIPEDHSYIQQVFTAYVQYRSEIEHLYSADNAGERHTGSNGYRYQVEHLLDQLSAKKLYYRNQMI